MKKLMILITLIIVGIGIYVFPRKNEEDFHLVKLLGLFMVPDTIAEFSGNAAKLTSGFAPVWSSIVAIEDCFGNVKAAFVSKSELYDK
jgi:hypothetical protein